MRERRVSARVTLPVAVYRGTEDRYAPIDYRRSVARAPPSPAAALAETRAAPRQWELLCACPSARAAPGDSLRDRPLPQPPGMLRPPYRHVHDSRQRLHAPVRLLLGVEGGARAAGGRRAGAR